MADKGLRRMRRGQRVRRVSISVDKVTEAAVQALSEREHLSYSAALCALATSAALKDADLFDHIKDVVREALKETMEATGYHPSLSRELARELVTGYKRPHPDYTMPSLDAGDNLRQSDIKATS